MCGIAGSYSLTAPIKEEELQAATESLTHRGPDSAAVWMSFDGRIGLGHTRLSVIDLAGGLQPMWSSDRRYVIVFNGEIYNFKELREELASDGYQFENRSDTEVVIAAYRRWGKDSFNKLNGMFAFGLYDTAEKTLILARDRTGIKPLYFHLTATRVAFGSELKSVLSWTHVPRRADLATIGRILRFSYPVPPRTSFQDCQELLPGSYLEFSPKGTRRGRYWSWARQPEEIRKRPCLEEVEEELTKAVSEHMISDVPVGAFLSGGIDSSLIVAMLANAGHVNVSTFNVKFEEGAYDESQSAKTVAAKFGTLHHEIVVDKRGYDVSLVERVLDQFDQPYGDSSAIPAFLVCRAIREHVKVALGGDGGDEMFGGYRRFYYADIAYRLGRLPGIGMSLLKVVNGMAGMPADVQRQFSRLFTAAEARGSSRLESIFALLSKEELFRMSLPQLRCAISSSNGHSSTVVTGDTNGMDLVDRTVRETLPGDYLRKIDVMSSAHGLEVRVPFLSNRILDLAQRIPPRLMYNLFENKIMLRAIAKKQLPPAVARKRKHGFGIPLDSWLGQKGRREITERLRSSDAPIRMLIDSKILQDWLDQFTDQTRNPRQFSRYGLYQRVYLLFSLDRWLRRWNPSL